MEQPRDTVSRWGLAGLLLIFVVLGVVISHAIVARHEVRELDELEVLADLKARQVADWLAQRRRDAMLVQFLPVFNDVIRELQAGDPVDDYVSTLLAGVHQIMGYETVLLVEEGGRLVMGAGEHPVATPQALQAVERALASGEIGFTGVYALEGDASSHRHLDIAVPMLPVAGRPGLATLLRLEHDDLHFGFLQDWALRSESAEALLLRDEGDYLKVISQPRFGLSSGRLDAGSGDGLAGPVIRGERAPGEPLRGRDLRGERALGVAVPVPGDDWWLLLKISRAEVRGQAWGELAWVVLAFLLLGGFTLASARIIAQRRQLDWAAMREQAERDRAALAEEARRQREEQLAIAQQREQLVRQLSLAVEQSPDSIVITNLDAEIEYVNQAFTAVTGYSRGEVIGQNPRILQSGRTPQTRYEDMWSALTRGEAWRGEFHNRRKDGSEYVELGHIAPLRQADGTISHYVAVKQDITEHKALAEELERHRHHLENLVAERTAQLSEARERAESASRAKSAFLANMSHEIRTPLNAIVGLAHLLRQEAATPSQEARLEKVDAAARHLLSIISDILDISKIEAGKFELEHRDFHLSAVLDHVRSVILESAQAKGLTVEIDRNSVPLWLRGDPARLRQALLNLAGNAVKFTEEGRIELRAHLLSEDEQGLFVRFEVEDTGIGVPEERLAHLFKAFEQADASVTRRFGGTGLGLAVTRRLAELMGGEVGARSTDGVGSVFWFDVRLERGCGVQPAGEACPREEQLGPADFAQYIGASILLAEDNPVNREVASQLLHGVGLAVDCAADGAEALRLVEERSYHAVLMDVQMPEMDGLTATRLIRALPDCADLPILALTANVFAEDRRVALAAGMNDFIPKPVEPECLYRTLLKWLAERPANVVSPAQARPQPGPAADSHSVAPRLPDCPGLDVRQGLASVGGNPGVYLDILNRFLQLHGDDAALLKRHVEDGDLEAVRSRAHSLKGAAGTVGAMAVAATAMELERAAVEDGGEARIHLALAALGMGLEQLAEAVARCVP